MDEKIRERLLELLERMEQNLSPMTDDVVRDDFRGNLFNIKDLCKEVTLIIKHEC